MKATDGATIAPAAQAGQASGRLRALLWLVMLCLLAGAVVAAAWWLIWSRQESTDNAYVAGDQIQVSARQPGNVVRVLVHDTQRVHVGQVLVELDRTDAVLALDQAEAALAQTAREVRQRQIEAERGDARVARARIASAQAEALLARRERLYGARLIAVEDIDNARDAARAARADLTLAQADAAAARAAVAGTDVAAHPLVARARARYLDAWVRLGRTVIRAPRAGQVAQRTVQAGQQVAPGQALLRLVPLDSVWIDANFKEAQLRHLRIGQPVRVTIDQYGRGVPMRGHVAGFSAGTGAAFALLPPLNAAGNWVKVVQRLPVRIELDPDSFAEHPLRIGLSAQVAVDITDRSGPMLAPQAVPAAAAAAAAAVAGPAPELAPARAEADRIVAAAVAAAGATAR
ncbi:MAG: HlyD family efflux transporter periplasmic adaptor subunit [Gammaproteobacteria bacterium]